MIILSVSKYKGSTVCIELEGRPKVFINKSVAAQFHLREGARLPESALEEIILTDTRRKAREYALHLLEVRDYGFGEMRGKLEKCYRSKEIALEICNGLRESGFLDDRKFAEKKARYLFEVKREGYYKAKFELKRCGLDDEIIAEAIEPYLEEEDVRTRLEELVEKKYERYLTDEKGVRRVKAALARLGYGYDDINAVIGLYDIGSEEW